MRKILLVFTLILFASSLYAQESISEILAAETKVSFEDIELVVDGISTDIYSKELLDRAKAGNGAAQNALGCCYLNGEGINKDLKQAAYWISKSVENNYLKGICTMGYMYENGLGVEKNPQKAVELYRKSALMGCPGAWCNLASCYEDGKGTDKDIFRAKAWFEKGARFGYRVAQVRLSYLLIEDENYHDALYWLWRAAKQKSSVAFAMFADFYEAGIILPKDVTKANICKQKEVSLQAAPSTTAIFDPSFDFNIDITSISNSDIIEMINNLLR